MWPWEHLAFGYLAYSSYRHFRTGRPPRGDAIVALAVGTQLPDLVDKPLAWTLSVLPSGHSLGHSLVTAVPLSVVVLVLAYRANRTDIGVAFTVGYLSHLAGDIIYPLAIGKNASFNFLLWPILPVPPDHSSLGFLARFHKYFGEYLAHLGDPAVTGYVALELVLMLGAACLWLFDGLPGLPKAITRYVPVIGG